MLVVKAEIWPGGDFDRAFEISRIGIANLSGPVDVSDYKVTALLARERGEIVVQSKVHSHQRELGWVPLVKRALTSIHLADDLAQPCAYDDAIAELLRKGHRV